MKTILPVLAVFCIGTAVLAAPPERYLHVKVDGQMGREHVRVNVPLSLAEKIIPAINQGQLRDGKVQLGNFHANGVDLKALLDAVRSAPDGEFVTVQEPGTDVRVAKVNGKMVVHVIDKDGKEKVDVNIPWAVAEALASDGDHQLNVEAAIQALEKAGDTTLVTVTDNDQTVRVWIDSRNTSD
ncbi:MAG TPA: hypothetical protein VNF00_06095, partial [Candidatus Acidoferrales bacterium]|nr:hypothetical protein [Candidatus Acidoferrales bacterium]